MLNFAKCKLRNLLDKTESCAVCDLFASGCVCARGAMREHRATMHMPSADALPRRRTASIPFGGMMTDDVRRLFMARAPAKRAKMLLTNAAGARPSPLLTF